MVNKRCSKVDRFMSNKHCNDLQPILRVSSNAFCQKNT